MTSLPVATAEPFDAVVFDLHGTLIDQGPGREWLAAGWQRAGREGDPADVLGREEFERLSTCLERIWYDAADLDPASDRDLDPRRHRAVFDQLVERMGGVGDELRDSLYATLTDGWVAYDDARPVLSALRDRGVRVGLLSNVGFDIRPVLERTALQPLLDDVVLSCEVGVAKPHPAIFTAVLEGLGAAAGRTLMVGDKWRDDAAAGDLGIRTLILPPTNGGTHGLGSVLSLVLAGATG